jgi:hypothetical protein
LQRRPPRSRGGTACWGGAKNSDATTVDRSAVLTAQLECETANGFSIETRTATQAVIVRRRGVLSIIRARPSERRVLSVDQNGLVTTRDAEPLRW